MIKHIHLNECDSTQDLLKEQLNNQSDLSLVLVSCENQISGRGRGNNRWKAMPGTLCFSLNLLPSPIASYTALEISVIIAMYFNAQGKKLSLKWPNDLLDQSFKKCGGILIQVNQNFLITGIGLNFFTNNNEFGSLYSKEFELDKKLWSFSLAKFITENRFKSVETLRKEWLNFCGHLNQMVRITEGSETYEGIFQGLGQHGEAELCIDGQVRHLYNGSLRIIS